MNRQIGNSGRIWILFPLKQRAKREVLHHRKFREYFGMVHLDHPLKVEVRLADPRKMFLLVAISHLVDLRPSSRNTGDVEQHWTVLPEWALLDIVDESNGAKVHVLVSPLLYRFELCNFAGIRSRWCRSFLRNCPRRSYWSRELGRPENVRQKRVVVQTPYSV
jgi:hypothetical protein